MNRILVGLVALVGAGCGETPSTVTDGGGAKDSGSVVDSGTRVTDSGMPVVDAGRVDSGMPGIDAGIIDAGTPATCAAYCASIQANCTGNGAQYSNLDACLGSCAGFAPGAIGMQAGNNLECRAYHARAAVGDPTTHCSHAGPAGDGVCGANCDGFCAIQATACTAGNMQFATVDACKTACGAYAGVSARYDSNTASRDSFKCRMYYLSLAATAGGSQATAHCPHIAATSATCHP